MLFCVLRYAGKCTGADVCFVRYVFGGVRAVPLQCFLCMHGYSLHSMFLVEDPLDAAGHRLSRSVGQGLGGALPRGCLIQVAVDILVCGVVRRVVASLVSLDLAGRNFIRDVARGGIFARRTSMATRSGAAWPRGPRSLSPGNIVSIILIHHIGTTLGFHSH